MCALTCNSASTAGLKMEFDTSLTVVRNYYETSKWSLKLEKVRHGPCHTSAGETTIFEPTFTDAPYESTNLPLYLDRDA